VIVMNWVEWIETGGWSASRHVVPMVPAVAREVLEFSTDPNVSPGRIANVVKKDPVLATRILQLANSAAHGARTPITSINDAVVRVGTESARNVMTAICVASILADKGAYGNRGREVVDHGIGTAYIGMMLADVAGASRDDAFVYGLLHDIGKLLIHQLANRPAHGVARPAATEVAAVMAERHAEVGGQLLTWWQLPEALREAVAFHHHPERAAGSTAVAIAYAANRLAHRYGFGCPAEEFDPLADPIFASLAVDAETLERIDREAPIAYDVARRLAA
jgi:putative nucleotidyltransferase with HDIG domain